ncbi:MAG: D-aminoacylase [Elusimicrobia bacterium]|nr:D-aminoacylase [Elusimicrobiota bacterium]
MNALLAAVVTLGAASALAAPNAGSAKEAAYDLIFAGGRVVDGTGAPWFRADVGVVGDRIAAIGNLSSAKAKRRVDASRLVVAPGFIDLLGQSEYNVLVDSRAASKITQGITTEITGEGSAIAPVNARMVADGKGVWNRYGVVADFPRLADYWAAFRRTGSAINLGTFVGAGGVRDFVVGQDSRTATADEIRAMETLVAQAMEDGALGLSTALIYVPGRFASTEEIVSLSKVAARYGGSYITHQRSEGDEIDASLAEVFRIAKEAAIPADVYHIKLSGKKNWGRMEAILRRLEEARAQGLDVAANVYPWTASANGLDASLPAWARDGGREKLVARLKDPETLAKVKESFIKQDPADWSLGGPSRILITSVMNPELKKYEGKTLEEIGRAEAKDPFNVLVDVVIADNAYTERATFGMSEDDVRAAVKHPLVAMCTDSGARAEDGIYSKEKSHPRAWATVPRILGRYVRDEKLLPLEEAVRKMTSLPAARVRLRDRGILRAGFAADIVAFDPETIRERSTYADPIHYAEGVPYVVVNGRLVVDEGKITRERPGRPLLGPGAKSSP